MKLGRILKYADYAVTIILFGLLALEAVSYSTGFQMFYVDSSSPSSMSPTMNYGGVALEIPTSFNSISNGSIISFHKPIGDQAVVVHRVTDVISCSGQRCFETKGDNNVTNPTIDPWNVTSSMYIGQVVLIIPYLGYLSPALWGFQGLYTFLPIIFVILLLGLAATLVQNKEKK